MASSMTGFGISELNVDSTIVTVELKSINNRFFDVSCRLPPFLAVYERNIKDIIHGTIQRGKIFLNVSLQSDAQEELNIQVDSNIVKSVHTLLNKLREDAGIEEDLSVSHFLNFSEIFQSIKEPNKFEKTWELVKQALIEATAKLKEMRDQEGAILTKDIKERIRSLEEHVESVEKISKENLLETYEKMKKRVTNLIQNINLDEDRLYNEIAIISDKMDITEECVRLRSHHEIFNKILHEQSAVGKKLTFLLQEMNREANTISSKASSAEISHHVVEMKEEIEKLREQVQNIE